jgi:hypothetical protein
MHLSRSVLFTVAVSLVASAKPTAELCSPLELVIARGTFEPGRYGLIVGDPLVAAVTRIAPQVTAFNVAYPANADRDSSDKGTQMIIDHLTKQSGACPTQKYVNLLSQAGYIRPIDTLDHFLTLIDSFLLATRRAHL